MSSLAPRTAAAGPTRVAIAHAPHTAASVQLRLKLTWSLSRAAAASAGLLPADGDAEPVLELELPWAPGQVHDGRDLCARLVDGGTIHPVNLEQIPSGAWALDSQTGLYHLDLPGLVQITARAQGGGIHILYARTEVLGRLGLAGGRYDFAGAVVG